ncbi:hypothetical protein LshimejAT787_0602590 [Lyophyllum shimeji]|uniref:Uncharacterized protein n=1 Tax=Lyophyllum shimeji TaxID=47721 RepID=A0A9P3PMJ6_LYOSH|nr:hypothetical protein LshimejAT787_0602590 [Lyophyllum shimeji]
MLTSRIPWAVLLAVAGPVVAQILPTPTLAARQDPSPSPVLVFNSVEEPVSCASTVVSWLYAGPDVSLSLFVTNVSVPQTGRPTTEPPPNTFTNTFIDGPSRRSLQPRGDISLSVANGLSPSTRSYNWTVNVPEGNYQLTAVIQTSPPYVVRSASFFVQLGTDSSCLSANPAPSASTSNPSDTSTPSATTSSTAISSSSLPTFTPIGGASNTPVNKGAIAGGVVAGAVVLLGAVGLYLFFLWRPKRNRARSASITHPSSKGPFAFGAGGGGGGRWGGLDSVDSHMAMHDTTFTATPKKTKKPYASARHQSQASSVGPFAGGISASQGDIQTSSGYPGSPYEEKYGSPDEMGLATLGPNGGRSPKLNARSYSSSTFSSDLGAFGPDPAATQRRPSLTTNSQASPRRPSVDSTVERSPFASPPTSPVVLGRSPSTGAQTQPPVPAQRKTPRKPVPAYTAASPSAPSPSLVSPAVSPYDSPVLPLGGGGHYATRAERGSLKSTSSNTKSRSKSKERSKSKGRKAGDGSSTNASSEELGSPQQPAGTLEHKSSFGPGGVEGKQLHYLIPDMPLGQQ